MNGLEKIINAALKFLEKRLELLGFKITTSVDKLATSFKGSQELQSRTLTTMAAQFDAATKRMTNPEFDVQVDLDPLLGELREMAKVLRELVAKEGPETETSNRLLMMILEAVKSNQPEKLGKKFDALDVVFKGLKPKESTKFDDAQMKGLMAALTGSRGVSPGGGVLAARSAELYNVSLVTANTQYSFTFPANTVSYAIRLRSTDIPVLAALASGKFPVSGDGTAYFTIPAYFIEKTAGMDWSGKILYLQADTATQVAEIICYTA